MHCFGLAVISAAVGFMWFIHSFVRPGCLLPRHWVTRVVTSQRKVALVHVGKVDIYHTWIKHIKAHILSIIGVSPAALYQESNVILAWLAGTDCKDQYVSVSELCNKESGHLIKFQLPTFCVKSKCLKASTSFGSMWDKSTQNMPWLCHKLQNEPYQNAWMKQETCVYFNWVKSTKYRQGFAWI